MVTFRTDSKGIVRDSDSIYWFNPAHCDIFEGECGTYALVKESVSRSYPVSEPELWEYLYGSDDFDNQWNPVRSYKSAQAGRVGMLRRDARLARKALQTV